MKIPLFRPIMNEKMLGAARDALRNEHLVMGESVCKFEEEFARYIGVEHAVSVSSGTDALRLALLASGLGHLSVVYTVSASFVATANAAVHAGLRLDFADVDPDLHVMTGETLQNAVRRKRAGAVVPVHLYGYPAPVEEIRDQLDGSAIIIEDACQAHGASRDRIKAGALGDIGAFSFYSTKNMTVGGDGGMVTTDNDAIAAKVAKLRNCGRRSRNVMDEIGYTSRLNTVNAAIGRVQLQNLDKWNTQRIHAAALYRRLLGDVESVQLPPDGSNSVRPVYHQFAICVPSRDRLQEYLRRNGIETGVYYPVPIHKQPCYRGYPFHNHDLRVTERWAQSVLSIPIFAGITDVEVRFIAGRIREFFERRVGR